MRKRSGGCWKQLQLRLLLGYAEGNDSVARKCLALTVKKLKMQSWENFGRELDSNYRQANKVV